jgi:hypothetical protein
LALIFVVEAADHCNGEISTQKICSIDCNRLILIISCQGQEKKSFHSAVLMDLRGYFLYKNTFRKPAINPTEREREFAIGKIFHSGVIY